MAVESEAFATVVVDNAPTIILAICAAVSLAASS